MSSGRIGPKGDSLLGVLDGIVEEPLLLVVIVGQRSLLGKNTSKSPEDLGVLNVMDPRNIS